MRLAPSRTRELSWREREAEEGRNCLSFSPDSSVYLPVCLPVCPSLHPCYTVSEWGECCSPKANRQTDRCFAAFQHLRLVLLLLSSLPPFGLGFFLVCFCHSLGCVFFFWFGFIFGILLQKTNKNKV